MPPNPDPTRITGTRQDTWEIIVQMGTVSGSGGMHNLGIWDKKTGGDLDSDEVKYYPGNMGVVQSLGGRLVPNNLTIQRIFDRVDDSGEINRLLNGVGQARMTVTQRPLNIDGSKVGAKRVIWTGVLKRVLIPDVDSEATSAALIEIEVSVDSAPTWA